MKTFIPYPLFQSQAFATLITMIVLNGLYVNPRLITIFKPLRYSLLLVLTVALIFFAYRLIKHNKIKKNQFTAFFFHTSLLIYGLALGAASGGLSLTEARDYLFLILSLLLTLYSFQEINSPPPDTHTIQR